MESPLNLLKQIQALSEQGQHFAHNDFDLTRYKEIEQLCFNIIENLYSVDPNQLHLEMHEQNGYKTPKVDIRAVVFNDKNQLLFVKEKIDGKWTLPGGWADIGYTPSEVAVKETREEAGVKVEATKLLAVLDKRCHSHPQDLYYIYKIFIECKYIGKDKSDFIETSDAGFFSHDNIPSLSTPRNTIEQINMLFDFKNEILTTPLID